jgi:hypothetical protein
MYQAGAVHMGAERALLHKLPFISLGFLITLGLRALYRRLWNRSLTFLQIVGVALVCSYLFAQVWAACFNASLWYIFGRDVSQYAWTAYLAGSLNYTFVFVAWSALYFSIKHYQDLQLQKVRTSAFSALAQEARLKMLRYQLNPHFLFNALNSIHALIHEDQDRAGRMIDQLSEFLRYTLVQDHERPVPLSEELDAMRNYLAIEQIRFEDKLVVTFDVEPGAEAFMMPGFLIHPLVENAVKHGMATSALPLRLRLAAYTKGGALHLEVANTGRLAEAGGDGALAASASTGTGLKNVRARLAAMYPRRHRFEFYERGGWVHAVVEVYKEHRPVLFAPDDAETAGLLPGGAPAKRPG